MARSTVVAATVLVLAIGPRAHAGIAILSELPDRTTRGTLTIDAPPAAVYQLVTDYARWPAVLSDVASVRIESGDRARAHVRFHSRVSDDTGMLVFDNIPDRLIRFRGEQTTGLYRLTPIDGGTRTQVTADLHVEVGGIAGWFVSDAKLRSLRRKKLQIDLDDVARWFARHRHP